MKESFASETQQGVAVMLARPLHVSKKLAKARRRKRPSKWQL